MGAAVSIVFRRGIAGGRGLAACSLLAAALAAPVFAGELGTGLLDVEGGRLIVSPESQTVPFDTPTIVETRLEGFDFSATGGVPPADLRVLADFTGPEIDGVLLLETVPGEPLRIPRLRLEGEYVVENVRLVQRDEVLLFATPRSTVVRATEILLTRVTSRALTLDEIQSLGIVIGEDNFQALNFTFGFGIEEGETIDFDVPIILRPDGLGGRRVQTIRPERDWRPPPARFSPPQIAPFLFQLPKEERAEIPTGGCEERECFKDPAPPPIVGVIAFPTELGLLHQFFSVVLMVQNGAPEGDPLAVRDLTARLKLPPGLRQAETNPPTPLGVPVPVRVPGPDGEVGTGDDLTFLVAQASGEAEFLLEGLREGTHVVSFDLAGVLEGLPAGPQPITGQAQGAVVVRDPHLQVTFNHPEVVRTDEQYPLHVTVANIGPAPVNLLSLRLPPGGLSGVTVVGSEERSIDTLAPGEAETVTFDLIARVTGKVIATTAKSGSQISPDFELSVGISNGIPLSPDVIVLPRTTEVLPEAVVRPALSLVGLGHSLSTARSADLTPDLPRVSRDMITHRVYRLTQAARHVVVGEELFDAAAVLAAEWNGARDRFRGWDELRRRSDKGLRFAEGLAAIFAAEAAATSPAAMVERFAATTASLPPLQLLLATGEVDLELASRAGGERLAGDGSAGPAVRELPFADLYPLPGAQLALLTVPEESGYRAILRARRSGLADLHLVLSDGGGGLRAVRWRNVELAAGDLAVVEYRASDAGFTLHRDRHGDGVLDDPLPGTAVALAPRPFAVVAARQNELVDPSGHVVDVLFSRDVDPASLDPRDPSHFELPGLLSNGGFVQRGLQGMVQDPDEIFAAFNNFRMVRVVFDNPVSPLLSHQLTVRAIGSADGAVLDRRLVPVTTTVTTPGGRLEGTVIGPDGEAVPFAAVELVEFDLCTECIEGCVPHRVAAVQADAGGRYAFDFVRAETCDLQNRFTVRARDPVEGFDGEVTGRLRFAGETAELNVVMLGRGRISGRVTYDDGTVPSEVEVLVYNPIFDQGRRARVESDGRFEVSRVAVGTVTLTARDGDGNFVFATVELPFAGSAVEQDLVILLDRSEMESATVRGTVVESDGTTPVAGAFLALYVDQRLVDNLRSAADGSFDFGTVPAGVAEIEVFDPETRRSGGNLFFDLAADQAVELTVPLRDERGTIEGRVFRQAVDGTLTPLADMVVWVDRQQANTVSDEGGFFRLEGVLAGNVSLRAADPRTFERTSIAVTVTDGATLTQDLFLVEKLDQVSVIRGQVLGFDGQPVHGALIHIALGYRNSVRWVHEVSTDADGRFVLSPVAVGRHPVHAISGSSGGIGFAEIRFPGDSDFVTIRFKRG
ncbi:MAG: hypothetical protein D6696_14985, partial [Acidobacteria bacterium]